MTAAAEPVVRRPRVVRVSPADNVAVAVEALQPGDVVAVGGERIEVRDEVPAGHKLALGRIAAGAEVTKYGWPIGRATDDVERGQWVHSHNLATALSGALEYSYAPSRVELAPPATTPTWEGFRRASGCVGTRNDVWVVNTVGCVNWAAERIARAASERTNGAIDGVHAFAHPYGCSQLGDDLNNTRRVLAGLLRHPNAGGVLVLGLGCENNQLDALLQEAGPGVDRERLRFFNTQDVFDEFEAGVSAVAELAELASGDRRTTVSAAELVLGHKCGGSDGFSGISANPLLGCVADRVTSMGGTVLLTEVPEMFGAERVLMSRAADERTYDAVVTMVNAFKEYFLMHGQPVYENPSPGNKAGGLTTLEEKSLGAIQKGGRATVTSVLRYGEPVRVPGLALLESPGNDGVSSTAMVASGATVLLFTTGRGTPLGFPAPTIKVSSNSMIAARKPHWIDFDAGTLLDAPDTMESRADALLQYVLDVASGRAHTNNETNGVREIAIWKEGVTL